MSEQEAEQELTEEQVAEIDAEDGDVREQDDAGELEPDALAPPEDLGAESGAAMEKMGKSLDALQRHVARRIGEILGDDAGEWEECEICNYWNTPGWRHKGPLPSEVEDVVRVALGGHGLTEYLEDEYSRACEKCNGIGFVLTGSKAAGQETLQCLICKGMGWVAVGDERRTGAFATPNGSQASQPAPLAQQQPAVAETPELAAARELLQGAGWMAFPPIVAAG